MTIAVCDANERDRSFLIRALEQNLCKVLPEAECPEIQAFQNTELLLGAMERRSFDVVFLGIAMPAMNGMEAARVLRARRYRGAILFVAETPAYGAESYEVDALYYLVKPYTEAQLRAALRKFPEHLQEVVLPSISVVSNRVKRQLLLRDIVWIEAGDHCAQIHTFAETLRTGRLLSDLYGAVCEVGRFVKCNRGCVVNIDYVVRCDSEFVYLRTGERILMNLRNSRKIRQQIHDYLAQI